MAERQKSGKTTWKKYHDSSYQYFLLLQRYSSSTIRRPMLQPLVLHWSPRHAAGLTGMDGTRRWDVPKSPLWLGHRNEIFMYQPQRKSLGKILRDQKAFAAGQAGRWGCQTHTTQIQPHCCTSWGASGGRIEHVGCPFWVYPRKHQLRGDPNCFPQGQEAGQTENQLS